MKATELKIGDWVCYKGKPTKICSLDIYAGCGVYEVDDVSPDDRLDPIPLTAEILEKNGWEKQGNDYIKENDGLVLRSVRELFLFFIITGDENKYLLINDIDYVHQLQHLLWALEIDDDLKI